MDSSLARSTQQVLQDQHPKLWIAVQEVWGKPYDPRVCSYGFRCKDAKEFVSTVSSVAKSGTEVIVGVHSGLVLEVVSRTWLDAHAKSRYSASQLEYRVDCVLRRLCGHDGVTAAKIQATTEQLGLVRVATLPARTRSLLAREDDDENRQRIILRNNVGEDDVQRVVQSLAPPSSWAPPEMKTEGE